jgi:hypothetical protein
MALDGKWFNELGSEMNITMGADGKVTGTYQTAVADDGPLPPPRPLLGIADAAAGIGTPQSVAFVVNWRHAESETGSVTAWSGQLRALSVSGKTEEVIVTTWLLTTETAVSEDWTSTLVGKDFFARTKPPQAQIDRALALRRLSPLPTRAPAQK